MRLSLRSQLYVRRYYARRNPPLRSLWDALDTRQAQARRRSLWGGREPPSGWRTTTVALARMRRNERRWQQIEAGRGAP